MDIIEEDKDPFDAIVDAPFDAALSERYLVYALSTITARSLSAASNGASTMASNGSFSSSIISMARA